MEFVLDKWKTDYMDDLVEAMQDKKLVDSLKEDYPYPFLDVHAKCYIEQRMMYSEEKQRCRAILLDGKLIGGIEVLIGSGIYSRNADLHIWLKKEYRCRGIGTQAVKQMADSVFSDYDVVRIEAKPYVDENVWIAEKMLHSAGLQYEGTLRNIIFKNGKMHSYKVFSMIKE
ncbi:MAG: GNAT family N-acetyltransferase [Clostridia bacterium]|nr:GNAT family N-acetyltransferase [Clostridia bacterium]